MARLKRNAPEPLYVHLEEALRADIVAQRFQPHRQLPSERELCARHGVDRMTVRQALQDLTREGLIYRRVACSSRAGVDNATDDVYGTRCVDRIREFHLSRRPLQVPFRACAACHLRGGRMDYSRSHTDLSEGSL